MKDNRIVMKNKIFKLIGTGIMLSALIVFTLTDSSAETFIKAGPAPDRPKIDNFFFRDIGHLTKKETNTDEEDYIGGPFHIQVNQHEAGFPALTYYAQKETPDEVECVGDENECSFLEHFENGNVKMEGVRRKGVLDGTYREYFKNGNLRQMVNRSNGNREGEVRQYYENGGLRTEKKYAQGALEGAYRAYYRDGSMKLVGKFTLGKLNGVAKSFDKYSTLRRVDYYLNNELQGVSKSYHENGYLVAEYPYRNNMISGTIREYDADGNIIKETVYKNGVAVDDKAKRKTVNPSF